MEDILAVSDVERVLASKTDPGSQFVLFKKVVEIPELVAQDRDSDMIYKDILRDMLYLVYKFGEERNWTPEQIGLYVSIMKTCVLESFFSGESALDLRQSYARFAELVKAYSVENPPCSSRVFTLKQVVEMIDNASISFFKHYRTHARTFQKPCPTQKSVKTVSLEFQKPRLPIPSLHGPGLKEMTIDEHVPNNECNQTEEQKQ